MSPTTGQLPEQARVGRTFLVCAMAFLASMVLLDAIAPLPTTRDEISDKLGSFVLLLAVCVFVLRGGRWALALLRGCLGIVALVLAGLVGVMAYTTFLRGIPAGTDPTNDDTLPFVLFCLGIAYAIWALFFSKEVKAFLEFQRTRYQKRVVRRPGSPPAADPKRSLGLNE